MSIAPAIAANPRGRQPVESKEAKQTTGATFQTSNAKLYFPVVYKWWYQIFREL